MDDCAAKTGKPIAMKAFSVLLAILANLSIAAAQATSTIITPSPSQTSSRAAQTYTVTVGANHDFAPNTTVAEVGDIIGELLLVF
jgi:hypothetical protein